MNLAVVNLTRRFGWGMEETGGGCEALTKPIPEGGQWVITTHDRPTIPATHAERVDLGVYDCDGNPMEQAGADDQELVTFPTLQAAMLAVHESVPASRLAACYGCGRWVRDGEGVWNRKGLLVLCGHECPGTSPDANRLTLQAFRHWVGIREGAF